jgi:glycosyltransferase involved in cell wall biosynthesis
MSSVAVVIPCYNAEAFLEETLRSVMEQTRSASEIVVVDDGSSDRSVEIAGSFKGVRVIRQANGGVAPARNTGVRSIASEHVVLLDADDRLLPHAIDIGMREITARPGCAMVYGYSRDIDTHGRALAPHSDRVDSASYATLLAGHTTVPPSTIVFRRDAMLAIGDFHPRYSPAEDYEFYLRLARRFPIHFHGQLVSEYRLHPGNTMRQSSVRMLHTLLRIEREQERWIEGDATLAAARRRGCEHWKRLFAPFIMAEMMDNLRAGNLRRSVRAFRCLARHQPSCLLDHAQTRAFKTLRRILI